MWSEVSHIRQPHDVVIDTNSNTGQNEAGQEQIFSRAQQAGKAAIAILNITGCRIGEKQISHAPHTMIGKQPVYIGEFPHETGLDGLQGYILPYVVLGTNKRRVEQDKRFRRPSYEYTPNLEDLNKVGVIYLSDTTQEDEFVHLGSAHWTRADSAPTEEMTAIEKSLEVARDAVGRLTIVRNEIAS